MGRMQMELHTGIDLAVALVRQDNLTDLLRTATRQLSKTFGLDRCWALELDMSGRTLHCSDLGEAGEFDCGDFSHPFAHVLRSGQPQALSRAASHRLDHAGFQALFEASGRPRSLWLEPLQDEGGRLLGVLVLCRDDVDWQGVVEQPLYTGLRELLVRQWVAQLRTRDQAWQRRLLKRSLDQLHDTETLRRRCERLARTLVGGSESMVQLRTQIVRAAGSQLSVLVQGETGCGKDVVARGVHDLSARASGPLVVVNCAAIPDTLLESELFGHTRGAFSGADQAKEGLLAQADGGTLFLDEIGDFPLTLQPKLLRFIQDKEYERVGDPVTRRADVRILAATNLDLTEMAKEGRFREDLLYRLNVITLTLPPLRERTDDILTLADRFLAGFVKEYARPARGFSEAAQNALLNHGWPGNIRELRNVIERASIICNEERVDVAHLGLGAEPEDNAAPRVGASLSLDELEKAHIAAVLASSPTLEQAARTLGIDASTLYRKRKQFGL